MGVATNGNPLAVGAVWEAQAGGCGYLLIENNRCTLGTASVEEVESTAPEVFTVLDVREETELNFWRIDYQAVAEGTAELEVSGWIGGYHDTASTELEALSINQVDLLWTDSGGPPRAWRCGDGLPSQPAVVSTNAEIAFYPRALHDDTPLRGRIDPTLVLSSDVATIPSSDRGVVFNSERLTIVTQASPGVGAVRSDHDPSFVVPLDVREPVVTEMVVSDASPDYSTNVPDDGSFTVDVMAGPELFCADSLMRHYTVDPSSTCYLQLDGNTQGFTELDHPGAGPIYIARVVPGQCSVTITVEGTSLTTTKQFAISM